MSSRHAMILALVVAVSGCTGSDATMDPVTTPDAAPDSPLASACGACPGGYTCGTANGVAVCRRDVTGIPRFSHIFVIVMENLSLKTLDTTANQAASPFLHGLKTSAAWASDYHGVTHPSLPNYIALTSGDSQGIGCDCSPSGAGVCNGASCNLLLHGCSCEQQALHVGDQLEAAGLGWRDYGEDMGAPCNQTDSASYATRHVPFLYYHDVQGAPDRCKAHVVDYGELANDLGANRVPELAFIAPNLTNDMHDPFPAGTANITHGDTWLATAVGAITATDAYKKGGLLVIVWDEDDLSGVIAKDDPIPMFVLSPYARTNYTSAARADHYALLATIEDGLGLPRMANAITALPLVDFFPDR